MSDQNPIYTIDASFYEPETRWDFYVSEKRKKIWARELEILFEFDRICKKHGLKYRLDGGTLLGAIRHSGFVPWDDDLDVNMTRAEYEQARIIMKEELQYPFEWQDLYTNLELCTPEQITSSHMLPFAKIRNRLTTAIEPPVMPSVINQGIWIDVFPFDEAVDDIQFTPEMLEIEKELYVTVFGRNDLKELLLKPESVPAVPKEDLRDILGLPVAERFKIYEQTLCSLEGVSTLYSLNYIEVLRGHTLRFDKAYFDEITELPFEGFMMPVSARYHEFMTLWFGDYMTPVVRNQHTAFFDPDVPYEEYFLHPEIYTDELTLGAD